MDETNEPREEYIPEYSADPVEEKITIKQGGKKALYLIRGLDGPNRDKFLDFQAKQLVMKNGKPVGLKSVAGMDAYLISLGLYDASGTPVPQSVITPWPGGMQASLAKRVRESLASMSKRKTTRKRLTGERLVWFQLASHLHLSLRDCKKKVHSREFVEWKVFFEKQKDEEIFTHNKLDHYLAQLAMLLEKLYRSSTGQRTAPTIQEHLLNFSKEGKPDEDGVIQEGEIELTEEGKEAHIKRSMAVWGGIFSALERSRKVRKGRSVHP